VDLALALHFSELWGPSEVLPSCGPIDRSAGSGGDVHNKQTSRTRKIFIVVWEHSVAVFRPRFLSSYEPRGR
jgi:hypothetical protein